MFTTNSWPLSHAWLHCLLPPHHFPALWLLSSLCFTLIPHCLLSFYPKHVVHVPSPLTFPLCSSFYAPLSPEIASESVSLGFVILYFCLKSCFHPCCFMPALILSPLYSIASLCLCPALSLCLSPISFAFHFTKQSPLTKSKACKK